MSGDELKKLYIERDNLENRIEKERSERERHGINGMSPDYFEISIERETLLEEKLSNVLSKIDKSLSDQILPKPLIVLIAIAIDPSPRTTPIIL